MLSAKSGADLGRANKAHRFENVRPSEQLSGICPVQRDIPTRSSEYHSIMERINRVQAGFAQRLFELRAAKGVSAREMSLSLGQGAGYVSNLENGHNLPSMAQFFAICTYLEVEPGDFFAFVEPGEGRLGELEAVAGSLEPEDLQLVLEIAQRMARKDNRHGRN